MDALQNLLSSVVALGLLLGTVIGGTIAAIRKASAQANGKIRDLAGEAACDEFAAPAMVADRATGLIGLAVRRELKPVLDEQARQGELLAEHGKILDMLMDESDTLSARAREHSDELQSLRDTLDD